MWRKQPLNLLVGSTMAGFGAWISCSGAGGILSAMYMTKRNSSLGLKEPLRATVVSVLASAACFVALGFALGLPPQVAPLVAGPLFFCTGVFASIEAIRSNTVIVQQFGQSVGAVSGTVQSYQSAAMLIAPWLGAAVIPHVSTSGLFIGTGGLGFLILLLVSVWFYARTPRQPEISTAAG